MQDIFNSGSNPNLFIPQENPLHLSDTAFTIEEDVQEESGELRIREENEENGELRIREENPKPILTIEQRGAPNPGFFQRWGSFFQFLYHGRGMDKGSHLRDNYKIKDEIKIIENPENELHEDTNRPVLEIQERGNEQNLPSPLHLFHKNQHVRNNPGHITRKKDDSIQKREDNLPEYGKTIYTIDKVYRHTTIDDTTREREFDFWHDKEVKCYTIGGISLAVIVVSFLVLPIVTAIVVAVVALAVLALMVKRVNIATPQVYKWRDQLPEYYNLRQEIGASHTYNKNGARKLFQSKDKATGDLIGKVFHPKEALKFWQEERTEYKSHFEQRMEGVNSAEDLDDSTLSAFYRHNPYLSYDYIAGHFPEVKPENHEKHEKLSERYRHLERAFVSIQSRHGELRQDLDSYKTHEEKMKEEWIQGVTVAYNQLVGNRPENKESEEYENWITKKSLIDKIYEHYSASVLNGFMLRDKTFNEWYNDRDESINKSETASRNDLLTPIWEWWKLAKELNAENWNIEAVEISEKIHHPKQIDPVKLPKPFAYKLLLAAPKENQLEGIDEELIKQFRNIALAFDPQKNEPKDVD